MTSVFHEGELAIQLQAGVQNMATRVGRGIRRSLPPGWSDFLAEQFMVTVASIGEEGHLWASVLLAPPGFVHALDEVTVQIDAHPIVGDPLEQNLAEGQPIGLLAINLRDRERMRLNGQVGRSARGDLQLHLEQVFGNCPKYIQSRQLDAALPPEHAPQVASHSMSLTPTQQTWIQSADTFFIASAHAETSVDVSHRGGNPGFIQVIDSATIAFPDYSGNMMFNTLGNLATNPSAGLLFIDFDQGHTLQLTGRAAIVWDDARKASFPGAERVITYTIEQVVQIDHALPVRFLLLDRSTHNPA